MQSTKNISQTSVEIIPKIQQFYNAIKEWLISKEEIEYYQCFWKYHYNVSSNALLPPSRKELWNSFFKILFTSSEQEYLSKHSKIWNDIVSDFAQLPEFISETTMRNLFNNSILNIFGVLRKEEWIKKVMAFHFISYQFTLNQYSDVAFEKLPSLVQNIAIQLEMPLWSIALFLRECHYPVSFSKKMWRMWSRWSDGFVKKDEYLSWVKTLSFLSIEQASQLEIWGEWLLAPDIEPLSIPCYEIPDCDVCSFSKTCMFYKKNRVQISSKKIENYLNTDMNHEIEDVDLWKFLAGSKWTATNNQINMIQNHKPLYQDNFKSIQVKQEDIPWVAFWKGVKESERRLQQKETSLFNLSCTESKFIYSALKQKFTGETQELFYSLILDSKYQMIQMHLITRGTLNQSLVHPREVFAPAIQLRAAAVVIIHNHPSGDPSPSLDDKKITTRLAKAGTLVGIELLDHIIFGKTNFYSFADEGEIFV